MTEHSWLGFIPVGILVYLIHLYCIPTNLKTIINQLNGLLLRLHFEKKKDTPFSLSKVKI
jgi:hypothetical protein